MPTRRMRIRVRPFDDALTWVSISGPVEYLPVAGRDPRICQMIALLARWHGGRLYAVLSAAEEDEWFTRWNESLSSVPRDLVRLRIRKPKKPADAAQLFLFPSNEP